LKLNKSKEPPEVNKAVMKLTAYKARTPILNLLALLAVCAYNLPNNEV